MSSILWEECDLYQCLGALELHNRVVAMGLDGTTSGHHSSNNAISGTLDVDDFNSTQSSPMRGTSSGGTPSAAAAAGGSSTLSSAPPSSTNGNAAKGGPNPLRGTVQPNPSRLSRVFGAIGGNKRPQSVNFTEEDLKREISLATAAAGGGGYSPNGSENGSPQQPDAMDNLRKSVRAVVAAATGNDNNMYYKYFLRSVLWRIYLRLLPFPYTGTSRETIVEDWPTILFRCRAWYGGQRQQFLHCYPVHNYVATDCAEFEPQNNLRTFSHFAGKAAASVDPSLAEENAFGSSGASSNASPVESFRKSVNLAASLKSTFRGSTVLSSGVTSAGFSQAYTNTSCLDGGPTEIKDDIITMDIKRTYVSADHEVPHHTLFMVLAMWRYQNPLVGYQQGMHEIAGNILLMLKRACDGVPKNTPPEVAQCANLAYVEADTYMLFDAFMNELGLAELFAASSAANQQNATPANRGGNGPSSPRGGSVGRNDDRMSHTSNDRDDEGSTPAHDLTTLEAVCHHIVFDLLKDHSLSLFNHFANTNVLDQLLLFLPRWIRNMFTREMTRPQVFAVWDGILAVYYADVVAAAISEQERDAAKRAILNANGSGGGGNGSGSGNRSMFKAFRNSIRFGKTDPNEPDASQFTHFINASDGNRTLGSYSPPLTEIAYVGEKNTSLSANVSPIKPGRNNGGGGGNNSTDGYDSDETVDNLARSHNSVVSMASVGAGMSTKRGIGRRVGGFLRTIAGVAVELLLYLEEDLLELNDDFSQLKRLTRTPLLPSTADAVGILLRATTIARTRPRGIVLKTINGQTSISATNAASNTTIGNLAGRSNKRSTVSALHTAQNSRLTREELLEQQKSVALVIANTANRLRTIMAHHAPAQSDGTGTSEGDFSSKSSKDEKKKGGGAGGGGAGGGPGSPKSFTISAEEVGQLQGVLLELEHLVDKLV